MKYLLPVAVALLVSACGKPAPIETAGTLVANPERLKELRAQCKADHAKVGDAQCNAVAEATRRRFMGGGTPYTPPASSPAELSAPAPVIPASPPGDTAED
ncbi:EexN family lipoprotein [Variovorax paradoxus]|nr:EexN family lipoprotein [Variovorax paradoxus]